MGVERIVRIADSSPVAWPAIHSRLVALGEVPAMRMIDSELAFPDELPPDTWRELRIAIRGGMVTLKQIPEGVSCVIWGNADETLQYSSDVTAWAVAATTGGRIVVDNRELSAEEFARAVGIKSI